MWLDSTATPETAKKRAEVMAEALWKARGPMKENPEGCEDWGPTTLATFLERVRKARESAGPDGWTGLELSALPLLALHDLYRLQVRWGKQNAVPKAMQEARMVNLTKEKKVKNGRTDAADLRPISVFSSVWRLYTGCWLKAAGMERLISHLLGSPTKQEAYATAARVMNTYEEDCFFATLDYSQCFDRMSTATSL